MKLQKGFERIWESKISSIHTVGASRKISLQVSGEQWCQRVAQTMEERIKKTEIELEHIAPVKLPNRAALRMWESIRIDLWEHLEKAIGDGRNEQEIDQHKGLIYEQIRLWTTQWMKHAIPRERRKNLGEALRRGTCKKNTKIETLTIETIEGLATREQNQWSLLENRPSWLRRRSTREIPADRVLEENERVIQHLVEKDIEQSKVNFKTRTLSDKQMTLIVKMANRWHPSTPPLVIWAALCAEGRMNLMSTTACLAAKEMVERRTTPLTTREVTSMVERAENKMQLWLKEDVQTMATALLSTDGKNPSNITEEDVRRTDKMWEESTASWEHDKIGRVVQIEGTQYEGRGRSGWQVKANRPSRAIVACGEESAKFMVKKLSPHGPPGVVAGFVGINAMEEAKKMNDGKGATITVPIVSAHRE